LRGTTGGTANTAAQPHNIEERNVRRK